MSNIKNVAMITVCGRPNVGKSSLTNALVGEKVAIVSNKAQTTRNRIYGVVNREDTQYILLDTPGLHKAQAPRLGDYMVKVVHRQPGRRGLRPAAGGAHPPCGRRRSRHSSTGSGRRRSPASCCINKIDTVEPDGAAAGDRRLQPGLGRL